MREQITKTIKESLQHIYCDSCEFNDSERCDDCSRKKMMWRPSDGFINDLVEKITIPDAPAWKDVREELPQYGQGVIAYCQFQSDDQYELDIVYLELNDKWISTKIGCEVDVLYWLPLPAPPDVKEG